MSSKMPVNVDDFTKLQNELLELERKAELEQSESNLSHFSTKDLVLRGLAINYLILAANRTGLYGRSVLTFQPKQNDKNFPTHTITVGDIVGIYDLANVTEQIGSGVVTSVAAAELEVSLNEDDTGLLLDGVIFRVVKLANDVTYRRLKKALENLENESSSSLLRNCLFGISSFSPPFQSLPPKILNQDGELRFINERLDDSQKSALKFALLQKELAIIHGPPGTGKTTTVVEIISQMCKSSQKVLCCAPSNVAVDNLLDRLALNKVKVVRLGHPARVNADLQKYSLDARLKSSDNAEIVQDIRKDIDTAIAKAKKSRMKGDRAAIYKDIRQLRKELNHRESKTMKEVLSSAEVVLSTLTTAATDGPLKHLGFEHFDVIVIDECSQALELACWIALPFAKKAILAGDHCQLPPTIMSEVAAKRGFAITLMERILDFHEDVVRMLQVQYRMNEKIMKWSSERFYNNQLMADKSVENHLLKDLKSVAATEDSRIPLLLIDTTGCDMLEMETVDEISKANEGEVGLVVLHVEKLITNGLNEQDIAVIAPYNLQVELLRHQLNGKYPRLEIRSVDGFQGREKEAVILSLVRSNEKKEVGFLAESRRLNVAVTRGRRHVAVICDVETVSSDPVLKSFTDYLSDQGEIRSAMQYREELDSLELHRHEGMSLKIVDSSKVKDNQSQKTKEVKRSTKPRNDGSKMKVVDGNSNLKGKKDYNMSIKTPKSNNEIVSIETADDLKRKEFETQLKKFKSDKNRNVLDFPASLNSHDRLLIHEIAEDLNLIHESQGDGKQRHIQVKKKVVKVEEAVINNNSIVELKDQTQSSSHEVICSTCQSKVPRTNIELHKLRCYKRLSTSQTVSSNNVKESTTAKKGKIKKKHQKKLANEEEDFDSMLEEFTKTDKICNGEKCKAKVAVLGVNCEFCRLRFCFDHGMPEIHGCGGAARAASRKQLGQDKKLYPGSGRPTREMDPTKKKQLQSKLDKKLNGLAEERKTKKKDKSK